MSELHASEKIQFDWATADALVTELRSTANELDNQIGHRNQIGVTARKQWEGSYAQQFDDRLKICTGDAQRFITSLRQAANDLEELARLAHEEQHRREQAREWVRKHDDRNLLEQGWDWLTGGDAPPPSQPIDPPKIPTYDVPSTSRGSSTPAGRR